MKEITLSKRTLILSVLLGILIAAGILVFEYWPLENKQTRHAASEKNDQTTNAVINAIETIFQIDYRQGKQIWLDRICQISTTAGCELMSSSADQLWQQYIDAKTIISATIEEVHKLVDLGSEQVWEVIILLSAPLPGSNKISDTACIVLVKTENGWMFDRFLLLSEVEMIRSRQTTSETSSTEREGK